MFVLDCLVTFSEDPQLMKLDSRIIKNMYFSKKNAVFSIRSRLVFKQNQRYKYPYDQYCRASQFLGSF